jgi:hypothetical protein
LGDDAYVEKDLYKILGWLGGCRFGFLAHPELNEACDTTYAGASIRACQHYSFARDISCISGGGRGQWRF